MGACFADNSTSARPSIPKKLNPHNPISQIIESEGTEQLQERWKRNELKMMKNKMMQLSDNIKFSEFQDLFPKIKDFSQPTQAKIYQLFNYERTTLVNKKELFKALTLIRKIDKHDQFARFLFYIYTEHPKHEVMSRLELERFKRENDVHLKPETNDDQLEEHFLEDEEPKLVNLAATSKVARPQSEAKPIEGNLIKSNGFQGEEQNWVTLSDFQKIFQDYNLLSYQIMFSWDEEEEEQQLITLIEKLGIIRKKGDKVFILDYKWWLQWTTYVEQKYNKKIELSEEDKIQNYNSTKIHRKFSISKLVEPKIDTPFPAPGEIKNQSLLTKSKERGTQLLPNLVELDNIICLPEVIWNKLVLIYHGGPPIERTYPEIYRRIIIEVHVDEDCKFIPRKLRKFTNKEGGNIQSLIIDRSKNKEPYYKHPGEVNWKRLGKDSRVIQEVFNYQRTYLVMVPRSLEKNFQSYYNVEERKEGNYLKKRFKNYGNQINISVQGVLTRAEVTQIISHNYIRVTYQNIEGTLETIALQIDQNLEKLNPENLDRGRQINELPGLSNLGNTCYMNAVLQCLIRTPYFGKYLQQDFFEVRQGEKKKDELLLEEIAKLYNDSKSSRQDTVSTLNFKRTFDKFCPFFQGNLQHDAQQFLICLLERISEEIKSKKKETGKTQQVVSPSSSLNKKIVKFFSGKTEAVTNCLKCHNMNKREEPFFTFSLSLPELKETQYFYYYVQSYKTAKITVPVRYGITLDRKATVEDLINAISKNHKRPQDKLAIYTVFNNEILAYLEPRTWYCEIAHYLSFNVKLVCYQIQFMNSPTYYNYREKKLADKSVKIELRQRLYSTKTEDYKIVSLPFILEVTCQSKWDDLVEQAHTIIKKLASDEPLSINSTPILDNKEIKISTSGIRQNQGSAINASRNKLEKEEKNSKPYKIRVIKTDQYYQNYCQFCKDEFVTTKRSRGTRICKAHNCTFNRQKLLFDDQQFRNINDLVIIAVDWNQSVPNNIPFFFSHQSYERSLKKSENRKDYLEDLISSNFKTAEKLELRCEKKECGHEWAERIEKISVSPNILLLHLKRFRYEDNRLVKLTNNVEYPELLTLPGTNDRYELFGVAVHLGSGVGGHYTSFVKVNKKWYLCDDTKVSLASHRQHIDNNAYLLFYHKTDFEPSLMCLSF